MIVFWIIMALLAMALFALRLSIATDRINDLEQKVMELILAHNKTAEAVNGDHKADHLHLKDCDASH